MSQFSRIFSAALWTAASLVAEPSAAQDSPPAPAIGRQELDYANKIYLAYIRTPDQALNQYSEKALVRVQAFLTDKTSMDPEKEVVSLDIEKDEILFFNPLLWPVSPATQVLSESAQKKLQNYIDTGGLLIIDAQMGMPLEQAIEKELPRILGTVNLGPLISLPTDHILRRSFYVSERLPGGLNHEDIYVQAPRGGGGDNVPSVIVASRDWEKAAGGLTMVPGSKEWEKVMRGFTNMYIYAISGGYKLDEQKSKLTLDQILKP